MKILVATKETQGKRKNDFCFCNAGDIVMFGMECDGEGIDSSCGCKRSMVGVSNRKATTTMKVADVAVSKREFVSILRKSLKGGGWSRDTQDLDEQCADELISLASSFEVGDIV